MSTNSRRHFLRSAGSVASVLTAAHRLNADPLGIPIGCQTYPIREQISHDFPGALRLLSQAGFQTIELCSPVGYSEFAPVGKYKGPELRRMLSDIGLTCHSCHFGIDELRKNLDDRIAWAQDLGVTQMMVPSLDGPKHPTRDDVKRAAEEYNRMGQRTAKSNIQLGLHNEDFELTSVDGQRTYDLLLDLMDKQLVKFQFQCSTISNGFDAAEYFTKYPGRFISMHVQDWNPKTRQVAAVGQGSLDWKKIFEAAKIGGLRNYFVEMALPLMQASVPYLKSLQV